MKLIDSIVFYLLLGLIKAARVIDRIIGLFTSKRKEYTDLDYEVVNHWHKRDV